MKKTNNMILTLRDKVVVKIYPGASAISYRGSNMPSQKFHTFFLDKQESCLGYMAQVLHCWGEFHNVFISACTQTISLAQA